MNPALEELEATVVAPPDLTETDHSQMLALLTESFENVCPTQFRADIHEKQSVILVRDSLQHIRGFTSLLNMSVEHQGRHVEAVYTGDTIVDPAVRAARPMHRAFVQLLWNRFLEVNTEHFYWLDVTLTYQAYRLMRHFKTFVPASSDPWLLSVRDALATAKFGARYDIASGTVTFPRPIWLRPAAAAFDEKAAQDPRVREFSVLNPKYTSGVGLVCLAQLTLDNATDEAMRLKE